MRKSHCPSVSCNHYRRRPTGPAASSLALPGRTDAHKESSAVAVTAGGGLGSGRFLLVSQAAPLAAPPFKDTNLVTERLKVTLGFMKIVQLTPEQTGKAVQSLLGSSVLNQG